MIGSDVHFLYLDRTLFLVRKIFISESFAVQHLRKSGGVATAATTKSELLMLLMIYTNNILPESDDIHRIRS